MSKPMFPPIPLHVDASTGGVADGNGEEVCANGFFSIMSPGPRQKAAYEMRDELLRRYNAHDSLVAALEAVHKLISEGAKHGFNAVENPEWADRLFKSQSATHAALSLARPTQETKNAD